MGQAPSRRSESALASAAREIESEVERFEALLVEASRLEMVSEKTLQRARGLLEECASCEQRMATQLQAFVAAMQATQERQRACMEAVVELANRVQGRAQGRNALLERFAALGARAGEMNEPMSKVLDLPSSGPSEQLLVALGQVVTRTDEIVAEAEQVARDAREGEWVDIAKEADTLKQQVQSARNKVLQAQRRIAGGAPS